MIKIAANIIKGLLRKREDRLHNFRSIGWVREKIVKHQDDTSLKHLNLNGLDIWYKRPYELLHSYREIFENEIYRFPAGIESPLIIDCGSNIGLSVLYFKQVYPRARIMAFEPDSNNFSILQQNINKNGLKDVEAIQAAVWTADGEVSFEATESEASHIAEKNDGKKVKAIRLQRVLEQYATIDFIKVDIEGAEWVVMKDCMPSLRKIKYLFLEYHGKAEETWKLNELLSLVNEAGFGVYFRNAADLLGHPFIEKRASSAYDVQLNLFCYR